MPRPVRLVFRLLLLAFAVMLMPASSMAAWSLGANLGIGIHDPSTAGDATTLVSAPSQSNALALLRPGLRVGFAGAEMKHEGYFDFSLDLQSSGGDNLHVWRFAPNYQYNFSAPGKTRPFVTLGAGLFNAGVNFGGSSTGATSFTYGGGVGFGTKVSEDHGRIRGELRYDRLNKGKDNGTVLIEAANLFQLVLGFDLWM